MKKRLYSLVLCLAMLIAVFPTIGARASSASDIPPGTYTNADYSSSVTFKADLTFSFVINFGEGFATVSGTYSIYEEDDGSTTATLHVTSQHTGIVVNDVYTFNGIPQQDGQLYLTDGSAGIIPADTLFTLEDMSGSSAPTDAQIAAGRAAIATAVKSNNEKLAAEYKITAASGNTYTGYRGAQLDSWAVKEVGIADAMNLMPTEVNDYFQEPINRGDFAALVHSALLRLTGMTESQLMTAVTLGSFPDSSDDKVKVCAGLGIITGYDTGKFLPEKTITRQEAATMLSRLAETVGAESVGSVISFNDIAGLWSEDSIKTVSTLKDGYTGNSVMGGTGGTSFSPFDSYSRQQAVATIVRMVGVSAGGTSGSTSEGSYEAVSAAVEDKVNALGADGTLSGADIQAILDFAEVMEDEGLVKDLVVDGTSVLYTTADGTPSGIVIDFGSESEDGEAIIGSGSAGSPASVALSATNDDLYLKNNKVLFITSFGKNDATYYQPMLDGIQALKNKGYDVTVKNSASLTQYASIGSGDYGMIFLYSHGTVVDGQFYFWTEVDVSTAIEDQKYLIGDQVSIIDHIPIRDAGIYEFSREYYIAPAFFANNLKSDPLDDAYVQFISCKSMKNQNMANVFLSSGAKAVTGYTDTVLISYAADVLELTAENLSPAKDQPDGDELTIGGLESSVLNKLGLNAFQDPFYNTETKTEDKRKVITRFDAAGAENMMLAVNNESGTSTGTGLTLSGTHDTSKNDYGMTTHLFSLTFTNNTATEITDVYIAWPDSLNTLEQVANNPNRHGDVICKGSQRPDFSLKPGESYTFKMSITLNMVKDYSQFAFFIDHYKTIKGDYVMIPKENYVFVRP